MRKPLLVVLGLALLVAVLAWLALRDEPGAVPEPEAPSTSATSEAPERPRTGRRSRRRDGERAAADPVATEQTGTEDAPAARRLEGRVIDAEGRPVHRAVVWAGDPGKHMPVFTDADGRFKLVVRLGSHEVHARAPGKGVAGTEVSVAAGTDPIPLPDLLLGPGATIHGLVLDGNGAPLQAIRVRAQAVDGAEPMEMMRGGRRYMIGMADVITDAHGRFVMTALEDRPYRVWLDLLLHPSHDSLTSEPAAHEPVTPGGAEVVFRLFGEASVSGVVVDGKTGEPVTRFSVNGAAVEDGEGRFLAPVGKNGVLKVEARGYLPDVRGNLALAKGDAATGLRIELAPDPDTGTLVLEVVDRDGTPVTGYHASGSGSDFRMWMETCGSSDGIVRVAGVRSGKHTLWIIGDGIATVQAEVDVPRGRTVEHRVSTARGGAVHLRLLDEAGEPRRYVKLAVLGADGELVPFRWIYDRVQGTSITIKEFWGAGPHNLSDAEGKVTGLAAGPYRIRVGEGDTATEHAIEVPLSGEVRREIRP